MSVTETGFGGSVIHGIARYFRGPSVWISPTGVFFVGATGLFGEPIRPAQLGMSLLLCQNLLYRGICVNSVVL